MSKPRIPHHIVVEVIPSDNAFAENYLQEVIKRVNRQNAIDIGIVDADAGNLISLATVKAKWLSR
jgi:hypothetical protein